MGFLVSEGEERGPQPDGDLGSGTVLLRGAVTEVTGTGGSLAGAQRGKNPFSLVQRGWLQRRVQACQFGAWLLRGPCIVIGRPCYQSRGVGRSALKKEFSKIKARTQR